LKKSGFNFASIKKIVTETELQNLLPEFKERSSSFRRIFNEGIRRESAHHARYRELRQSLDENAVMSPIRFREGGEILEEPLRYMDVNQAVEKLSFLTRGVRFKRIYWDGEFGDTWGRIAGIYWPIFQALQSCIPHSNEPPMRGIKSGRCQLAILSKNSLQAFAELAQSPPLALLPRAPRSWFGWFQRHLAAFRLKKQWGRKLQWLLAETPIPEGMAAWYKNYFSIRSGSIPEDLR